MTTPQLVTDLMRDEGLRLTAYPDPLSPLAKAMRLAEHKRPAGWQALSGKPWTIGYGHTGPDVHQGLVWTAAQAAKALREDIADHIAELDRNIPWWRDLNDDRQDVLANMAFNLGWLKLKGFKNTLAKMKAGDFDGAAQGMRNSLWARQVGQRAERLAVLMEKGER